MAGQRTAEVEKALEDVYDFLCLAAKEGRKCPSNDRVAKALHTGHGRVSDRIALLNKQGRIKIEHLNKTVRRITIVATGDQTEWGAPNYRQGSNEMERYREAGGFKWPDYSSQNLRFRQVE